jgi:GNAT superfamily N-acetyltransferase
LRGLRLYVRPIDTADTSAVSAFLARHSCDVSPPAWGLLGKLLGDVVAVVGLEIAGDALRIDDLVVASELRRKRIGRAMLREVEQLAAKFDRRRVIVTDARGAEEFLRRVGFVSEGNQWVRVVS